MTIESTTIFEWFTVIIGGIISFLAGVAIWNNRARYNSLDDRLKKVEDRMNVGIPASMTELKTQITSIDGRIKAVDEKVDLISASVIQRMDKLERDMPGVIEAAMYRTILQRPVAFPPENHSN